MSVGRQRVALVSEVLESLLEEFGSETTRRSELFQAALQACAEESKRVKQGHEPLPLATLVERAREILARRHAGFIPEAPSRAPAVPVAQPPQETDGQGGGPQRPEAPFPDLFAEALAQRAVPGRQRRRRSLVVLLAVLGPLALAAVLLYLWVGSRLAVSGASSPEVAEQVPTPPAAAAVNTAAVIPPARSGSAPAATAEEPRLPSVAPTPVVAPTTAPPAEGAGEGARPAAARMISLDWSGRPPVFVIHFSSYREREKAQRDADELALRYHRSAYAARVDLPGGTWYRVLLGDFPTAEAARAFRDTLASAGTRELGGVYLVSGP